MSTVIAAAIGAVVTLVGIVVTARQVRAGAQKEAAAQQRANRLEESKVDAEAYDRARRIDIEVVATLRDELERHRRDLAVLRTELDEERHENAALRETVERLERSVDRMRRLLVASDIDIPTDLNL